MRYKYDDPELWQTIAKYPNYVFSTWGRVWNTRYDNPIIGYSFSPDYPIKVKLKSIEGVTHTKMLHRLVAEAFYTGYSPDEKIEFVNGNKYDCHVLNLRFGKRGVGYFKGGSETVLMRKLFSNSEGTFANVIEAAKHMDVTSSEVYDVIEGRRGSIRGVEFWWDWTKVEPDEYQPVFRPDGRALRTKLW